MKEFDDEFDNSKPVLPLEERVWPVEKEMPPTDSKGRPLVETMSSRAIAEETLEQLRAIVDQINEISSGPMGKMLKNGPSIGAFFGGK
jgi:hypothetical protein